MSEEHESKMKKYFTADVAPSSIKTEVSPSGRYRLEILWYDTKPGAWDVTLGTVFRVGTDEPIAKVYRNYSSFPFLFIEGHANGHDYLVCGEDYQGQTVIELDTGARRDHLPEDAKKGHGFCWIDMRFDAPSALLVADGCIWACPYERRFYDFAAPMSGWPELECDECIDDDAALPLISADGTIVCYQSEQDDDDEAIVGKIAATRTFKRDENKLVRVAEWVSESEQKRRDNRAEGQRLWNERLAKFRAEDPLYLAYVDLLKASSLVPESHEGIGITYDGWAPGFTGTEQRMSRRVANGVGDNKITIDLEWAWETGPTKVTIYRNHGSGVDTFFPHSIDGMREAFALCEKMVNG